MLFTQTEFLCLFVAVLAWTLTARTVRARNLGLLAASYYFYAWWDWRFLGLILLSTAVDFLVGRAMASAVGTARRRLLLVSLVTNLGLLGFFKYAGFFVASFRAAFGPLLEPLGFHLGPLMDIVLPVGISFYTFQTLSYTIDVYRGRLQPCDRVVDFALFVAFFPQLVAGPIVRAADLLPQLREPRRPTWPRMWLGFRQFTFGLFKKLFIADRMAMFVDPVFANPGGFDAVTTWLAVTCYAVQIYCDFSGYSDMAIGIARGLGFDFEENFDHPYLSRSITEFWRRWHISLSSWLRDYLYIPLGGNRRGRRRTYINLMATMLLGGLWHGAAWTFVAWGLIHGLALAGDRATRPWRDAHLTAIPNWLRGTTGWVTTTVVVLVAWVFFRAAGFADAWSFLQTMFLWQDGVRWIHPVAVTGLVLVAVIHLVHVSPWRHLRDSPPDRWYVPTGLFLLWWLVVVFRPRGFQPFLYFQF